MQHCRTGLMQVQRGAVQCIPLEHCVTELPRVWHHILRCGILDPALPFDLWLLRVVAIPNAWEHPGKFWYTMYLEYVTLYDIRQFHQNTISTLTLSHHTPQSCHTTLNHITSIRMLFDSTSIKFGLLFHIIEQRIVLDMHR